MDSALHAKSADEYLADLKNARYIAGIGDEEIQSIGFGSQAIRGLLSRRYMRRTQQPATAFICYMFHSEMEIDNIVRIVEAVRYGMEPSEIMQLLVII
ncbi:MAG: V-type ATPase subunit [Acutalibacteraceae bacterium]